MAVLLSSGNIRLKALNGKRTFLKKNMAIAIVSGQKQL